jgi:flavin-dependent thymidylate synthase
MSDTVIFHPKDRPIITMTKQPAHWPVVEPKDWMLGDRAIAEYFWESTDKSQTAWTCSEAEVYRVINFGMKAQPVPHGTPFGHGHLTVHVDRIALPVAEQMLRHRVQHQTPDGDSSPVWVEWMPNISKLSMRYVEIGQPFAMLTDDELGEIFYVVPEDDFRTSKGRPGHYTMEPLDPEQGAKAKEMLHHAYRTGWLNYRTMLDLGVCREQARFALPTGLMTRLYATNSYRNWFNWCVQRNDGHAQEEIRRVAIQVEEILAQCCPVTYNLWLSHGRRVI